MKDCRKQELAIGDRVVYPISQGSSSAKLIVGTVLEFWNDTQIRVGREFNSDGWPITKGSRSIVLAGRAMKIVLP